MSDPNQSPQTRAARMWTFAAMASTMASIAACGLIYVFAQVGVVGSTLVLAVAVLPPIVLGVLILYLDRMEPEPRFLLVSMFASGATLAIFVTMLINVPWIGLTAAALGNAAADIAGTVLYAPFTEEIAKGAVLLALFLWKRNEIHGMVDGIVYGSMVGLGFAFTENLIYFADALAVGADDFVATAFLRAGLSGFAHPLFTSMTGIGFAIAAEGGRKRWLWPLAGLIAGMCLHAIWNMTAILGVAWYVAYVVFFGPILLVGIGVGWAAARREADIIRVHLSRDVQLGLLTEAEVEEVSTLRHRRGAMRHYEQYGGKAGREAREAFHRSATRLAFERKRTSAVGQNLIERAREYELVGEIARYKRSLDPQWVAPEGLG